MYGYGNVSNHLSFVPSSGKSASKGFDTCERNHAAPIKESSRPREQCDTRRGAQLQESEGDRTSHRAWTSFSRLTSACASRAAAHAGRLQRQRTPPNAGAGAGRVAAQNETSLLTEPHCGTRMGAAELPEQVRELGAVRVRTTCVPAPTTAATSGGRDRGSADAPIRIMADEESSWLQGRRSQDRVPPVECKLRHADWKEIYMWLTVHRGWCR